MSNEADTNSLLEARGQLDSHGMLTCDACQRIAPPGVLASLCEARKRGDCELRFYEKRQATDAR